MDTDNNIPADAQEPAEGAAQTAPETSTPPADAQEPAGDAPAHQAGTLLGGGNDPAQQGAQGAQDAQQGAGAENGLLESFSTERRYRRLQVSSGKGPVEGDAEGL